MDATLRVVKVTHYTQLKFGSPAASQAPPPMLISVDEFNIIGMFCLCSRLKKLILTLPSSVFLKTTRSLKTVVEDWNQ